MLADSGWNYLAQWMTIVILLAALIAVVLFVRAIRRGNRRAWVGIGAVVVVLSLGVLAKAPASTSHTPPRPTLMNQSG